MSRTQPAKRPSRWFTSILTPPGVVGVTLLLSVPVKELRERLVDPDLWWHLRTGRLIAETGSIPNQDPFSFTASGRPWIVQEWGSELLLHWMRELFGLGGIIAYKAVLLFVVYALVARLIIKHMGGGMGAWALIALTTYAGAPNWTERPNLLSFVLFVVTLTLIERRDRLVWWFVPVALVWANLHGMVILGVGLVALVATAEWLKTLLRLEGGDRRYARRLALVATAGLAATLVNPAGPKLLTHALQLVREVRGIVTEWASPSFHEPAPLLFMLLLFLLISAFAVQRRMPDLTDLALTLAFTFLALQAVRNLLVSSIVLGVVSSRVIPNAIRSLRAPDRIGASRPSGGIAVPAIALAVVLATYAALIATGAPRGGERDLIDDTYPVEAIDALSAYGSDLRVFVYDVWSGMVIDRVWPRARVYADLRTDFYGAEHMRRYQRTIAGRPGWRQNLDEACVTHVLVDPDHALRELLQLDDGWLPQQRDAVSVTFTRTQVPPDC